jgi:hypothetical protein
MSRPNDGGAEGQLAARTVLQADADNMVEPSDEAGFISAAKSLSTDGKCALDWGSTGRLTPK